MQTARPRATTTTAPAERQPPLLTYFSKNREMFAPGFFSYLFIVFCIFYIFRVVYLRLNAYVMRAVVRLRRWGGLSNVFAFFAINLRSRLLLFSRALFWRFRLNKLVFRFEVGSLFLNGDFRTYSIEECIDKFKKNRCMIYESNNIGWDKTWESVLSSACGRWREEGKCLVVAVGESSFQL